MPAAKAAAVSATPKRRGRPPGSGKKQVAPEPTAARKKNVAPEPTTPDRPAKLRKVGPASAPAEVKKAATPQQARKAAAKPAAPKPAALTPEDQVYQRLDRAAEAMQPHSFQGNLPCRDAEFGETLTHLRGAVTQGGSTQVLFLSGMPGTGKTASVLEAVRQLQGVKGLPPFHFAHVNAMRLGQAGAIFSDLHSQLREKGALANKCAAAAAQGVLTNYFSQQGEKDPVVLLLIDEIDHLVTRSQGVLYRVFDWLQLPKARLAIVAVSNTMDLPERLLPRVTSRFGIVRVDYAPYRMDQILGILKTRLEGRDALDAFAPTALKLCAARVAAGSGDIRKALQLCRRALEVRTAARGDGDLGPADLKHLDVAEKELLRANPAAHAVGGLALRARRFLIALLLELRKGEADAVPLGRATRHYEKLKRATAAADDDETPDDGAALASLRPGAGDLRDPILAAVEDDPAEEVAFLTQRLEGMGLIVLQRRGSLNQVASTTVTLGGCIDTEDLAGGLEAAEEDDGLRELIRESGSGP